MISTVPHNSQHSPPLKPLWETRSVWEKKKLNKRQSKDPKQKERQWKVNPPVTVVRTSSSTSKSHYHHFSKPFLRDSSKASARSPPLTVTDRVSCQFRSNHALAGIHPALLTGFIQSILNWDGPNFGQVWPNFFLIVCVLCRRVLQVLSF